MTVKDIPKPAPLPAFMQGWLKNEEAENDKISVKRIYIDINDGNLHDGLIFSQIMYWYTPSKHGKTKLDAFKEGYWWLAKAYTDWWDECRINEHTARKAIDRLKKRGFIRTKIYRFNGTPKIHLRVNWEIVEKHLNSTCYPVSNGLDTTGQIGLDTTGQVDMTPQVKSLTDTTPDTTQKLHKKDIAPKGADTAIHLEAEEIAEREFAKPKKKASLDIDPEYKKLVRTTFNAWGTRTEGVASMLLGLADRGEYQRFAIAPIMAIEELKAYQFWQDRTSEKGFRPERAETIFNWVDKWRNTKEYQQWLQKQQPKPEPEPPESQPVEIAREPDFENVDIIQKIWNDAIARGENPALAALQYATKKLSANESDLKEREEARRATTTDTKKA